MKERRGLGRGLSALMADVELDQKVDGAEPKAERFIPIDQIDPNPDQPRRTFAKDALEELAASISEKGIIQPLILRPHPRDTDRYQIVAGERRWRAAGKARLHEVPAVIRDLDDTEVLEIAIVENIQRSDLNPVDEARGYRQLMDRFGHTQEKLAEALGKSRSHIANTLRLLGLPDSVLDLLAEGQLSSGHARALVTADDAEDLARQIIKRGLSVRETERLVKSSGRPASSSKKAAPEKDTDTKALENDLSAALGLTVRIDHGAGDTGGRVTISYPTLDHLDDICRRLAGTE